MNASAFRDLWALVITDVLKFSNCTSRRRARFENFKTSRATINQEMHEQVYAIFFIIFSTIVFWHKILATFYRALRTCKIFNFLVDFQFCRPIRPSFRPGLCSVAFNIFGFLKFSFSCPTSLWFEIAKRLSAILFSFSNLSFAGVSIATYVLHSIT